MYGEEERKKCMERHKRGKKRRIKEIIKFREEREERWKDKKTDRHRKKNV